MEPHELLDRFELLYPENKEIADLRRAYIDKDLSSIFRLINSNEELRKAVIEKNLHSIFRILDNEELRKAVIEENLHSIFRIVDSYNTEDLRKAVTEKNLHSIFRLTKSDDDFRSAVTEENLYSIFRLCKDEELRKFILEDNMYKLWPVLERYVSTAFIKAFKTIHISKTKIDDSCFSRGQLKSKLWLIQELKKIDKPLGTIFLCGGWYATLATMLFENNFDIHRIRSFDIDPSCAKIAEIFNKKQLIDKWKFKASTVDIMDFKFTKKTGAFYYNTEYDNKSKQVNDIPDTFINTSCEHIESFKEWYDLIPQGKLVILQSNNYFDLKEHKNCSENLIKFSDSCPMDEICYIGSLELEKYTRFMKIGYK